MIRALNVISLRVQLDTLRDDLQETIDNFNASEKTTTEKQMTANLASAIVTMQNEVIECLCVQSVIGRCWWLAAMHRAAT